VSGDFVLYRRVLRQVWPHRLGVLGVLVLNMLGSPLAMLMPVPLKIAVDSALGGHPVPPILAALLPDAAMRSQTTVLALAAGLLVALALLSQLQGLAISILSTYTAEKMLLDFRARIFAHVQRLSVSYHDMRGTADSIYRIQTDAVALQYITIDGLVPLVSAGFMLVGMIYVTACLDGYLALVALAVSPVLFFATVTYRPRLREQSRAIRSLDSSALAVVHEVLSALRVVQAFGREEHEENRYVGYSREGMRARLRLALAEGRFGLLVGATTACGTAAVLWIGIRHVRAGGLTLGDLLLVMAYLGQLYDPLKTLGRKSASLQGHLASIERAFELLDHLPEVTERPHALLLLRAAGAIAYRNVSFAYRGNRPVLHEISFAVPAGSCVGISGKTGAGKTTLVSLMARFNDPTRGEVLLDGVDVRDLKLEDLRRQIAVVLQEPVLFSASITENIAYARPEATEEDILRAAKLANAHDFIVGLRDGYQTLVGERGMRLSGGERQRISLARAFLKDAPILILDEPTSSVDIKTEAGILEAMERLMQGRTTFIIAHRLNTLERCSILLQIDDGRLTIVPAPARTLSAVSP
jgi:ATP-binding cassette, subfamily B, bacterial